MPTPHIESNIKDIANIVIMPGDPLRAKYIAENYLENYKLVNNVRGMTAYTGYYKNKLLTVFPSGMGIPSMGIYSYELFSKYNVDYIIRIGTVGAYDPKLNLGDVLLATTAYSDSNYAKTITNYENNYLNSSKKLNDIIISTAKENNLSITPGNILTTDVFYSTEDFKINRDKYNLLGVEMETFGLLTNAKILNKNATAILTVSDSFCYSRTLSSEEREKNLDNMIKIALNSCLKL